ncbi:hypothetical protein M9Y10_045165 [Tritrichomonas musculus]|uniref:Uncharacterized protein n=1 Tax=Tritrichomonas musculus TaxID=1915356 RepID=A0ABR2JV81_9EUKA
MLYKNGDGVEQDYNKAFKYFELAADQKNPKASYQMGILHFYCLIENHDLNKAREYFETSSKSNLNSSFYLGLLYENGICVDRDLNKSIEYFKQCANDKKTYYFSTSDDSFTYENRILNNEFYYHANNELGLIYITEKMFENKELSEKYLKEAGLNEFPFGQNCLGIFYQFYSNEIGNAQYLFEKASKSNFALSEFNLGYIYEGTWKNEESIEHCNKASDLENELIIFRNQKIEDGRLEISKSFIICYTNLKLSLYYLTKSPIPLHEEISDDFLLKSIFRP